MMIDDLTLYVWYIANTTEHGTAFALAHSVIEARSMLSKKMDSWLIDGEPDVAAQYPYAGACITENRAAEE